MNKRSKFLTTYALILFVIAIFSISGYADMYESEPNDSFETATLLDKYGNYNEKIIGTLQSATDEDYFIFIPMYTGPYQIVIESGNSAVKTLYDSSRAIVDETPNDTLRAELTGNQSYYIKIKCNSTYDASKAGYTISITPLKPNKITIAEVEYNSSFLSANILPNNTKIVSISASISQAGDEDYYMFTPRISGTYTIETTGTTDTIGYLYDNNGIGNGIMRPASKEPLTSNDDYEGFNFRITYNLSSSTTYYIKVTHWNPIVPRGDYNLVVSIPEETITTDIEGNTMSSAYVLYDGTTYTAQMNTSTDVDYFRFSAPTTGYYRIETKGFNNTTGEVYSSSGQLLVSDTDTSDNCLLEMQLQKNIAYYIKVNDRNGMTGNYTISVTKGKTLPLAFQAQQPYSLLCWATSASMISSYINNTNINRTVEIAKYDIPYAYSYQFNQPKTIYTLAEGIGRYITGYTERYIQPYKFTSVFGSVPFSDITKAIDMSSPVAFLTDGHFIVAKGYIHHKDGVSGSFIIYNDPWDGQEHTVNLSNFVFRECIYYIPTTPANEEKEVNESAFSADNIEMNVEKFASINNEGDVDWYKFTSIPGDYTVESFGMTDTYGEVYRGSIVVQNPDHINSGKPIYSDFDLIGQDNSSGANGNFKINFSNTGGSLRDYYIKVKHSSPYLTGNYSIKITRN
jgi:hypothetical protein